LRHVRKGARPGATAHPRARNVTSPLPFAAFSFVSKSPAAMTDTQRRGICWENRGGLRPREGGKVKRTILYIDDEVECLNIFEEMFGDEYDVRTAATLGDARRMFESGGGGR
jgi:hypothetical protein